MIRPGRCISAFMGVLALSMLSVGCARTKPLAEGVYVHEGAVTRYIAVAPDSSFYTSDRMGLYGRYQMQRDTVALHPSGPHWDSTASPVWARFRVTADTLIGEDGSKWVRWAGGDRAWDYAKAQSLWLTIRAGATVDGFHLSEDGVLHLDGHELGTHRLTEAYVAVSPPSPSGRLAMALTMDSDKGGMDGYVFEVSSAKVVSALFDLPFVRAWMSWSPDEAYALLSEASVSALHVLDVPRGTVTYINWSGATGVDPETEIESLDEASIEWTAPQAFRARINVECNFYNVRDCQPGTAVRSILLDVDAQTSEVIPRDPEITHGQ